MKQEEGWPKSDFDYWLESHISKERPMPKGLDLTNWFMVTVGACGGFIWWPLWLIIPIVIVLEILFRLSWIMVYLYAIAGLCMGKSKFYRPWNWNEDPEEEVKESAGAKR